MPCLSGPAPPPTTPYPSATKSRATGPEWLWVGLARDPPVTPSTRRRLALKPSLGRAAGVTNTLAMPPQLFACFIQVMDQLHPPAAPHALRAGAARTQHRRPRSRSSRQRWRCWTFRLRRSATSLSSPPWRGPWTGAGVALLGGHLGVGALGTRARGSARRGARARSGARGAPPSEMESARTGTSLTIILTSTPSLTRRATVSR